MTFAQSIRRRAWMLAPLCIAAPAAAHAQPQAVAGTRVTLPPPPGFVVADRFPGFMHEASGSSIMADPAAPIMVVGSSFSPADLSDLAAFSRERLTAPDAPLRVSNISGGTVTIDGAEAYELFGDAVEGSVRIKFYQVIVPDGSHYVIVQGMVGEDRAADWIPYFQTVARTLRRTR